MRFRSLLQGWQSEKLLSHVHGCGFIHDNNAHWTGMPWAFSHSTRFSGGVWHHSSKASRCEDLQVEEPVACRDCSSFHFHSTLARVLRPTLIGHQVVQVCEPREKRLLAPLGMMEAFHREQLALDGVMRLIE